MTTLHSHTSSTKIFNRLIYDDDYLISVTVAKNIILFTIVAFGNYGNGK